MIYAGIGARRMPAEMFITLGYLGAALAREGWILRSGAADGADTAFEQGCDGGKGRKEIYLPWEGFNGNSSSMFEQPPRAFKIAEQFHPAWKRLSQPEKHFHARNVQQVLGELVYEPCDMVVCWTPDGCEDGTQTTRETGGTGQAIRVATGYGIPIFNLKTPDGLERLLNFVANKDEQ